MTPEQVEIVAALVLPWAKEHHRDKYDATLRVSSRPDVYRRYLLRLVEIRWDEDEQFRPAVPLSVLEETSIAATLRDKDGTTIEVKGKQATGGRTWGFKEIGSYTRDEFITARTLKDKLDLELI